MRAGKQALGISYWEHGHLVSLRFRDLMNPNPNMTWKLPTWFTENQTWIRQKLAFRHDELIEYQIWHDCGKPYCRTIDEDGRAHYPDHANVSAGIWLSLQGDPKIGELIRDDMLCHQLRTSSAAEFAANPNALALLITALCELHANASMFGGIQSDSFKIKYKRLDKCGAIISLFLRNNHDL